MSRKISRNQEIKRQNMRIDVSGGIIPKQEYAVTPSGIYEMKNTPDTDKPKKTGLSGKIEETGIYINGPELKIPTKAEIEANKKREMFIRLMGDVKKTRVTRFNR